MAEVDLDVRVNAIVDKKFKEIEKNLSNVDKQARSAEGSFSKMAAGATAVGVAIVGIGSALNSIVEQAIIMEDLNTQFIAFTGSAEAAAIQVERIAEFSASTPFQLEDLANANRSLLAFGSSTEESLQQLTFLGEAAAATGSNVGELATIFGQIQAQTKLTGERFNQLVERGINIGPSLAESLGVAESEIRDLISAGQISADEVEKAFERMTTGSGQFAGSMERLSKTLSGSLSTASDNVSILAASLGQKFTPALVAVAEAVSTVAQEFNKWISNSNTAQIARIDETIAELEEQLDKLAEKGQETRKTFSNNGFLGTSVEDINNAKNQIDGSTQSIIDRLEQLREERDKLASSGKAAEEAEKEKKIVEEQNKAIVDAEKKLQEDLQAVRDQQAANRRATARAQSEEQIVFLQEDFEKLQAKEEELEVLKLENRKKYDEAIELQAQNHEDRKARIAQQAEQQRQIEIRKAAADELNFEKINSDEQIKFAEKTELGKARALSEGLKNISALQRTGSKEAFAIGKAAAIASAAIAIPETALQAYKSGVGIGGPPLGAVFAAAATATQLVNLSRIQSAKFQGFAEGGLVTGGIPGQDSVPAMLTPGEIVVPEKNFNDLGIDNSENTNELRKLNKNMEDQNNILFNIAQSTNDTARGTIEVAAGVANIRLPGQNNPGAGADYTDWNIETYVEANRILQERIAKEQSEQIAEDSLSNVSAGQANVQV